MSPIAIFAETSQALPAQEKIRMLRLFADCLEFSDPSGDGWTVMCSLSRAYNMEQVPMTDISFNWLLRLKLTETIVAFGAKSIWHGLQLAVHLFLANGRQNQVLHRLLNSTQDHEYKISQSHTTSIAHWVALRASQRELLPMLVEAGRFLRMDGFDWIADDITPAQFVRTLPVLYVSWSKALLNSIDKVNELVALALEEILMEASWTREFLVQSVLLHNANVLEKLTENSKTCSTCYDDYTTLGAGLVQPRVIAFMECTKTDHRFDCQCAEYLRKVGEMESPATSGGELDNHKFGINEEIFRERDEDISELCERYVQIHLSDDLGIGGQKPDPFQDAATLLYRALGRRWMSTYEPSELLCATCLLRREGYISKDGLGTEHSFMDMPENFGTFCSDNLTATF